MQQQRLALADLARQLAIALRLPRLTLQRFDWPQLPDDVVDAGEIVLGRLEPQFGLVAPAVQAGNAGGVFQDRGDAARAWR